MIEKIQDILDLASGFRSAAVQSGNGGSRLMYERMARDHEMHAVMVQEEYMESFPVIGEA